MASSESTKDFIIDLLAEAGDVRAKKMFGEYGIYVNSKFSALICDDILFLKPTEPGQAFSPEQLTGQPYPNAKPHFQITEDQLDDADWICEFLRITATALPEPKKKK